MDNDLYKYLRILRKRWWLIAIALALTCGLGMIRIARAVPIFQATAKVSVGLERIGGQQENLPTTATNLSSAKELLSTYAVMIETRPVADTAIANAGLPLTSGQIIGGLDVSRIEDTQLLSVVYRSRNPELAAHAANAVAHAFKSQVEDTSGGREPPTNVEVIESASVPDSPISPNRQLIVVLSVLLGLGLGLGLVYVADVLDVTIKSREDIESLGLPAIGSVPTLSTEGEQVYLESDAQGAGGESFRKVRTAIGFMSLEAPVQVILVTSAFAGEGKTTVALNIASAYALSGLRTILVECDLRRPSLHHLFRGHETRGLTTAIIGDDAIEDAVLPTEASNLWVMMAGAIPPNPLELLDSPQMTAVIERLRQAFDIVILDAPPMVPVADPAALTTRADGVLLVVKAGSTHRKPLVEAAALIEKAGGRLLGVLLNRSRPESSAYEYQYYYSYRADEEASRKSGRDRRRSSV